MLALLHADGEVMATINGTWPLERSERWIANQLEQQERAGHGVWVFRLRDTEDCVGRGALRHVEIEAVDEVELGYVLFPRYWGRGIATEIARGLAAFALDELRLETVVAFTTPENAASRRVMEKAGLAYERDFLDHGEPRVLYRLRAD